MPARLHPGVYVEEVPSGARSIEAAGTSTAIFVGEAERGPLAPTSIKGVADFERAFGGHFRHQGGSAERVVLRYAVEAFFANGGSSAYVLRAVKGAMAYGKRTDTGVKVRLQASSPGKWSDNVAIAFAPSSQGADRFRIFVGYTEPGAAGPTIVERWDKLSFAPNDENYVVDVLQRSLYVRWEEGAAVPAPGTAVTADGGLTATATDQQVVSAFDPLSGGTGGDATLAAADFDSTLLRKLDEVTDASLLVIPSRFGEADADVRTMQQAALDYAEKRPRQDLFAIADMPRHLSSASATQASTDAVTSFGLLTKTDFGAVYFPWLEISDPVGAGRDPTLMMGPASFVAGLYARTDQRRGVWKAPAGLEATLLGVRRLEYKLLDSHQDDLNPLGVNAVRMMPQGGNVVWGARTMRPASEWRYVPVRRMAIFLRSSIFNGIQWAVFEPNDEPLWANLRLTVGGFMEQLFRQGAFAGRTSREAFFVKCDTETTTEMDRISGIVNVWVGFAPLRPAEFVVVKLSQIVNQKA